MTLTSRQLSRQAPNKCSDWWNNQKWMTICNEGIGLLLIVSNLFSFLNSPGAKYLVKKNFGNHTRSRVKFQILLFSWTISNNFQDFGVQLPWQIVWITSIILQINTPVVTYSISSDYAEFKLEYQTAPVSPA